MTCVAQHPAERRSVPGAATGPGRLAGLPAVPEDYQRVLLRRAAAPESAGVFHKLGRKMAGVCGHDEAGVEWHVLLCHLMVRPNAQQLRAQSHLRWLSVGRCLGGLQLLTMPAQQFLSEVHANQITSFCSVRAWPILASADRMQQDTADRDGQDSAGAHLCGRRIREARRWAAAEELSSRRLLLLPAALQACQLRLKCGLALRWFQTKLATDVTEDAALDQLRCQ